MLLHRSAPLLLGVTLATAAVARVHAQAFSAEAAHTTWLFVVWVLGCSIFACSVPIAVLDSKKQFIPEGAIFGIFLGIGAAACCAGTGCLIAWVVLMQPVWNPAPLTPAPFDKPFYHSECLGPTLGKWDGGRRLAGAEGEAEQFGRWVVGAIGGAILGTGIEPFLDEIFGQSYIKVLGKSSEEEEEAQCVRYPSANTAHWCAEHVRHSHKIPAKLKDETLASLRDTEAELMYTKFTSNAQHNVLEDAVNKYPVCKYSIFDGLCMDALPMCHCADMTSCKLVCRNVAWCVSELHGNDRAAQCIRDECDERCRQEQPPNGSPCPEASGGSLGGLGAVAWVAAAWLGVQALF